MFGPIIDIPWDPEEAKKFAAETQQSTRLMLYRLNSILRLDWVYELKFKKVPLLPAALFRLTRFREFPNLTEIYFHKCREIDVYGIVDIFGPEYPARVQAETVNLNPYEDLGDVASEASDDPGNSCPLLLSGRHCNKKANRCHLQDAHIKTDAEWDGDESTLRTCRAESKFSDGSGKLGLGCTKDDCNYGHNQIELCRDLANPGAQRFHKAIGI